MNIGRRRFLVGFVAAAVAPIIPKPILVEFDPVTAIDMTDLAAWLSHKIDEMVFQALMET